MTGIRSSTRVRQTSAWPSLPDEVAATVQPVVPALVDEVVREIQARVPEYARPSDDGYARTVRLGAERAVAQFMNRIADPDAAWDEVVGVFHRIGRGEAAEGRGLETLQSALRVGAQVVLRQVARQAPLEPETVGLLGEALFVFLDEIAAVSADGYAQARTRAAGELELRRRHLAELLLADPPLPGRAVADAARTAGWTLPRAACVVLLDTVPERLPALPAEVLADLDRTEPRLIVPDPSGPGRRRLLDGWLRGLTAAVAPSVPVPELPGTLPWARRALALARQRVLPAVAHCDDHLPVLLLRADPVLLGRIADRRLAPLSGLPPARRESLAETLLVWLRLARINSVAAELHIHPQTVRYRLRNLRELFGPQLEDARTRFELELVLTAGCRPGQAQPDR